ncbi:unnamed protein product [Sphenostylis stenocarpa]|uniref:Uncharacterized protein n=1 Tax=Sphenostylis stenocarpa TaxID=92480 RepID=A0AA86T817_9FABA|nr:unnamed protein product [Sphenostylis stenocarpa]
MSSLGTSKGVLEIAKFGVYVTVPIILMYTFANNPGNISKFMGNKSYIEYPPEAERPPSPEELREMAREMAHQGSGNTPIVENAATTLCRQDGIFSFEDSMADSLHLWISHPVKMPGGVKRTSNSHLEQTKFPIIFPANIDLLEITG